MRILVAEDDPLLAFTLQDELEEARHHVIGPVATAAEGLRLAYIHRPEVALLNINLQDGSSGVDLARTLLTDMGTASIYISGNMQAAYAGREVAIGYLTKPYHFPTVLECVDMAAMIARGERPGPPPRGLEPFHRSFFN